MDTARRVNIEFENGSARDCGLHWSGNELKIISLEEARHELGEAGWSDLRFIAFCHGSVYIALPDRAVIWVRLEEDDYDELLEILTRRDRERAAQAHLFIEGDSTSLAA